MKLKIVLFFILIGILRLTIVPTMVSDAMDMWPHRGDAHFYAKTAEYWNQTGIWKWFEIYPVALKEGFTTDMQWNAIGTPWAIAFIQDNLDISYSEAAIYLSIGSYISSILLLYLILCYFTKASLAFTGALIFILFPYSNTFGCSASTDSLSQLTILFCFGLFLLFEKYQSKSFWVILLLTTIPLCTIRPHNQFFLLALFPVLLISKHKNKGFYFSSWVITLGLWKLSIFLLSDPTRLTFPYSFSFLVGTETYPGHSSFKHYFNGFDFHKLLEHKDIILGKVPKSIQFLKQYHNTWIPTLCALTGFSIFGNYKNISRLCLLIFGAGLFFGASGHLVPRYWIIIEPIFLLVCILSISPSYHFNKFNFIIPSFLSCLILIYSWHPHWTNTQAKPCLLPKEITNILNQEHQLLTTNQPSKLIDAYHKEILLLPHNLNQLESIQQNVSPIDCIIFTPDLKSGEDNHWVTEQINLKQLGFKLILEKKDWKVYQKDVVNIQASVQSAN